MARLLLVALMLLLGIACTLPVPSRSPTATSPPSPGATPSPPSPSPATPPPDSPTPLPDHLAPTVAAVRERLAAEATMGAASGHPTVGPDAFATALAHGVENTFNSLSPGGVRLIVDEVTVLRGSDQALLVTFALSEQIDDRVVPASRDGEVWLRIDERRGREWVAVAQGGPLPIYTELFTRRPAIGGEFVRSEYTLPPLPLRRPTLAPEVLGRVLLRFIARDGLQASTEEKIRF